MFKHVVKAVEHVMRADDNEPRVCPDAIHWMVPQLMGANLVVPDILGLPTLVHRAPSFSAENNNA